jgi:hypothetical protein
LSGEKRVGYIPDLLYSAEMAAEARCGSAERVMDRLKCRMKTPLETLDSGGVVAGVSKGYAVPEKILKMMEERYGSGKMSEVCKF